MHPQLTRVPIRPKCIPETTTASDDALLAGAEYGVVIGLKGLAGYAGLVALLVAITITLTIPSYSWDSMIASGGIGLIIGIVSGIVTLLVGAPVAVGVGGAGGIFVGLFFKQLAYYRLAPRNAILWGITAGTIFVSVFHILYIVTYHTTLESTLFDFLYYFSTYFGNKWWWLFFMGPTLVAIGSFGAVGYRINQRLPRRERWSDYD